VSRRDRCLLCGGPYHGGAPRIVHTWTTDRRRLCRLSWHLDCAARDPLHELVADYDAAATRAPDAPGLMRDAMGILAAVVAAVEQRHEGRRRVAVMEGMR